MDDTGLDGPDTLCYVILTRIVHAQTSDHCEQFIDSIGCVSGLTGARLVCHASAAMTDLWHLYMVLWAIYILHQHRSAETVQATTLPCPRQKIQGKASTENPRVYARCSLRPYTKNTNRVGVLEAQSHIAVSGPYAQDVSRLLWLALVFQIMSWS